MLRLDMTQHRRLEQIIRNLGELAERGEHPVIALGLPLYLAEYLSWRRLFPVEAWAAERLANENRVRSASTSPMIHVPRARYDGIPPLPLSLTRRDML